MDENNKLNNQIIGSVFLTCAVVVLLGNESFQLFSGNTAIIIALTLMGIGVILLKKD